MLTALAEISDTQAAMNLLGYESEVSSHKFVYLHIWPAVGYQNSLGCVTREKKEGKMKKSNFNVEREMFDGRKNNVVTAIHKTSKMMKKSNFNVEGEMFDGQKNNVVTAIHKTSKIMNMSDTNVNMSKNPNNNVTKRTSKIRNMSDTNVDLPKKTNDNVTMRSKSGKNVDLQKTGVKKDYISDDVDDPENHEFEPDIDRVKDRIGMKRTMYVDHEGKVHAISQHEIYRHRVANWDMIYRDPCCEGNDISKEYKKKEKWKEQSVYEHECGLKGLNYLQFVMHITLKKFPASGKLKADNTKAFLLNKDCPLYKSHYLHLNRKEKVPILAGVTRPCPPQGNKPKRVAMRRRWNLRANRFARYMGALLFPWDRHGDCGVHDWDQLKEKVIDLKRSRHRRDVHENKVWHCDAFVLQYLNNVATNMRTTESIKQTTHDWGSEFAHRFSKESINKFRNQSSEKSKVVSTVEGLRELVNQATAEQAIAATSTDSYKAKLFVTRINEELDELYGDVNDEKVPVDSLKVVNNMEKETSQWHDLAKTYNKSWVENRRAELNKDDDICDPIVDLNPLGTRRKLSQSATERLNVIRKRLSVNEEWVRVLDHVIETWTSGNQLLLFIHGGPGTGKTTLAKSIIEVASLFNFEHRFSATSGVAGLMNNGTTIHHLLAQQGELTGTKPNVNKIRLRIGNARVIFVDEVSRMYKYRYCDDMFVHIVNVFFLK